MIIKRVAQETPVLSICLGARMTTSAFGQPVYLHMLGRGGYCPSWLQSGNGSPLTGIIHRILLAQ